MIMLKRRWFEATIGGLLCGTAWPVLTILIFPYVVWVSEMVVPTRGQSFFVVANLLSLPTLGAAALAGLGSWLLIRARDHGSGRAALCLVGAIGGSFLGALGAASSLGVSLFGAVAPGHFVAKLIATGAIVGALLGLAVAVWVSLRPSPRPSP